MKAKIALTLVALALMAQMVLAQAPRWAVGQFRGNYKGAAVSLTINRNGDVFMRTTESGRTREQEGRVSGGTMTVGRERYSIEETRNGFRAVSNANPKESVNYTRTSGSGGSDWEGTGNQPPEWAVGRFTGYNSAYDADIELNITERGSASAQIRYRDGKRKTQNGSWKNGDLYLEGIRFDVTRQGRGITTQQTDSRRNRTEYTRDGSEGGGGYDVPNWAVGEWTGYNLSYDADIDLTIRSSGQATARINYRKGKDKTQTGRVEGGRLILDGIGFTMRQEGRDVLRTEQSGDRNNWMEYRKVGSSGGDSSTPPNWAVGSFEGFNRFYQADVDLTISSNGQVKAYVVFKDGRRQTQTGRYERNDKLVIDGIRFTVSSSGRGVRLVQDDDRENSCDYRRR